MAQRRDLREQLRDDVLAGDEQVDRFDARTRRRLDEVLAFDGEQPGLDSMLAGSEKLPDEPELLVLTRFDQALGRFGVGLERGLRALGDGSERFRVAHGDVGE